MTTIKNIVFGSMIASLALVLSSSSTMRASEVIGTLSSGVSNPPNGSATGGSVGGGVGGSSVSGTVTGGSGSSIAGTVTSGGSSGGGGGSGGGSSGGGGGGVAVVTPTPTLSPTPTGGLVLGASTSAPGFPDAGGVVGTLSSNAALGITALLGLLLVAATRAREQRR